MVSSPVQLPSRSTRVRISASKRRRDSDVNRAWSVGWPIPLSPKRSSAAPLRNQTLLSSVMLNTASLLDCRIVAARAAGSSAWVTAATSSREPIRPIGSPSAPQAMVARSCTRLRPPSLCCARNQVRQGSWRVQASRSARSTRSASGPARSWRARPMASAGRTPVSSPTPGWPRGPGEPRRWRTRRPGPPRGGRERRRVPSRARRFRARWPTFLPAASDRYPSAVGGHRQVAAAVRVVTIHVGEIARVSIGPRRRS